MSQQWVFGEHPQFTQTIIAADSLQDRGYFLGMVGEYTSAWRMDGAYYLLNAYGGWQYAKVIKIKAPALKRWYTSKGVVPKLHRHTDAYLDAAKNKSTQSVVH